MTVNLFLSNTELYEHKIYIDFDFYMITFLTVDNFKAPFQIQYINNQPIICKVILREKIVFYLKKTVYIRMNYTGLLKGRSFIITTTYPTIPNILFNTNTFYIVIITNPTNKILTFNKSIYLGSIHKCIDTLYIITNIIKAFTIVAITFTTVSKPFTAI